jgi:hypothetical protein
VNSGALSTVHAEQWRWCNEEEEEGRGADLLWLRGCAAGGCWPENGLDGDWPFFVFSVFFSLLLCSPLFLFFQCFFFCFSWCRFVINDREDDSSWRLLWGGAGGGYADNNRWFFLLSLLLCFHLQDLAMALVVLLLFFLSVCVASVNNVLLSLPWMCC